VRSDLRALRVEETPSGGRMTRARRRLSQETPWGGPDDVRG